MLNASVPAKRAVLFDKRWKLDIRRRWRRVAADSLEPSSAPNIRHPYTIKVGTRSSEPMSNAPDAFKLYRFS